ncbi:MAG TPA: recombination mediator RecR [Opitutales bacterium]|nr:recombination mediator RecR [Opitutales bacterium]
MTPAFERLQKLLKQLPGLGYRSSERIALHLLVGKPELARELVAVLQEASETISRCTRCGNLAEGELCGICTDPERNSAVICVVEHVPDLIAFERSGAFRGVYHVLHGKLSPINSIGPEQLNLKTLEERLRAPELEEMILALSNDVEGEATCHYITETLLNRSLKVSRIGFGLPSGSGVLYADAVTLKSALEGRRTFEETG